jgi:hypothetical protein
VQDSCGGSNGYVSGGGLDATRVDLPWVCGPSTNAGTNTRMDPSPSFSPRAERGLQSLVGRGVWDMTDPEGS